MTDSPFRPAITPANALPWRPGLSLSLLLAVVASIIIDLPHLFWSALKLDREMLEAISTFDDHYDPIVIEAGQVSILGDRIVDTMAPDGRVLIDPHMTVSDEELAKGGRHLVIRSDTFIDDRGFQRREYKIAEMQNFIGVDPLRIDSASLQHFWQTDGSRFARWMLLLYGAVIGTAAFVKLVTQALIVGPLVRMAKGSKVPFGFAFSTALIASLAPHVLLTASSLAWDPGFILRSMITFVITLPAAWLLMPSDG